MSVSKRVRYEVLRRDSHTCRYCGGAAPDVKLTVDHVVPVALGGSDDPTNLVTACADCNGGKTSTTPGAELVAEVNAKALAWAHAMQQAADERAVAFESDRAVVEKFRGIWDSWTYEYRGKTYTNELPADFGKSVRTFLAGGLNFADFDELIEVAMHSKVPHKWRYFCGCAWRRVREAQERAAEIVGAQPADDAVAFDLEQQREEAESMWEAVARDWHQRTGGRNLLRCLCLEYCGEPTCILRVAAAAHGAMLGMSASLMNAISDTAESDPLFVSESLRLWSSASNQWIERTGGDALRDCLCEGEFCGDEQCRTAVTTYAQGALLGVEGVTRLFTAMHEEEL